MDNTISVQALEPVSAYTGTLMALVQEHPDEPVYSEAYRWYHVFGDGLRDYDEERLAKLRAGK